MLSYSQNILNTITGKTSLQDVTIEQLQEIVDAYPYFGAAQFFLSKKMVDDKLEGFENALQKTALHFDNTLWLHFNLAEEVEIDPFVSTTSNENINQSDADARTSKNIININAEEVLLKKNEHSALAESIIDTTQEEKNILTDLKETNPEITHEEDYDEDDELLDVDVEESTNETANKDEFESNKKLSNLLKEHAEAFEKPLEDTTLPIETVPHHRIDYFESQGIKLDPEKESNDKLGSQLKRFTDWLKQMKRISPNLNNLETDVAGEIQAQNMAARSNDPKEIVTETMAEVLIKQGKPEEAIDIYEKLSFSNPSKSAYFAAKITELKA